MGTFIRFLIRGGIIVSDVLYSIFVVSEIVSSESNNDLEGTLADLIESVENKDRPLKSILDPINTVIQENLDSYENFLNTMKYKMLLCRFYISIISPNVITEHMSVSQLYRTLNNEILLNYYALEEDAAAVINYLVPMSESDLHPTPLEFLNPDIDYDRSRFNDYQTAILDDIKKAGNKKLDKLFAKIKNKSSSNKFLKYGVFAGIGILVYYAYNNYK